MNMLYLKITVKNNIWLVESKQGIGQMMIEHLKEIAMERSCYKVILNCNKSNVGFYKKCGFYQKEIQMRWDRPPKH